ncbi:class I SAM-dependent methyltransferase [Fodinicola acaciae]|uniref:class I SAM-dependent methyltransferase n=1 Tax=Fodinicola acaciae TaxID=2681555 RepID=UPI0013D18283|nr:class I SAM-dependent methyltransferase [Fodinicola acaciae]
MTTDRANYGVDAPYVPTLMIAGGVVFTAVFLTGLVLGWGTGLETWWAVWAIVSLVSAASYLYTTRVGKIRCWSAILDQLELRGDERVLDLGCGRGLVLIQAAKRLPVGAAIGIDLWRGVDQSGNAIEVTARNAAAEGVSDRVQLNTGDMTKLPYDDASFDLVVSSLAIHNIPSAAGRATAIDEAIRVLRPGGRLAVADIRHVRAYARRLEQLGARDVRRRGLGWRFWYGPWMPTKMVTATKPN